MSLFYDSVAVDEIVNAHAMEALGYPEDEAASLETLRYRQAAAPDLFLGVYLPKDGGRALVGFICATLSPATALTNESMSKHVPGSKSVCIHSVCVSPDHRRNGIALGLLKEYTRRLEDKEYERILLITHEELQGLYEKAGFHFVGKSAVMHGSRPWFEMLRILHTLPVADGPQVPPGLWDALQRASTRARPKGLLLSAFPGGLQDVSDASGNRFDLLCPREGCGSIILKSGVANVVERESVQMEPTASSHPALLALPTPPALMHWWRVTPNAMAFENIGFSRSIASDSLPGESMKLLICAECDIGPLGWCKAGGSEFWLACNRVGYRE